MVFFLLCSGSGEGTDYMAMAMSIKEEIYNNALQLEVEIDPARAPLREVRVTNDRKSEDAAQKK